MAHRFIVAGVIVLAFVGAGAAVAIITRDDDTSDSAGPSTTTTALPASSASTASTAPPASTTTSAAAGTDTTGATGPPPAPLPDPCGAETAAIRAAVDDAVGGVRDHAQIDTCRLAAVDPSWAVVNLVAKPGDEFTPATVLVHGGGGAWSVVDSGAANSVGCGRAPQQVLVDLGVVCTSTGGGT